MDLSSISAFDLYFSLFFLGLLFCLLFLIDYLYKKELYSHFFLRKIVHIVVGVIVVIASRFLESSLPIVIIAVLFAIINFISIKIGKFSSIHGTDRSYGTVYYPIAILVLAIVFWQNHLIIFQISVLIMAISDAFAAIFGEKYGERKYILIKDTKTAFGSLSMFLSTVFIIFMLLFSTANLNFWQVLLISGSVAIIATAAEVLSINGSDNLTVPLFSSFFLYVFLSEIDTNIFSQVIYGILFSLGLAIISIKFKYLSYSGAVATFILGAVIFGLGGIQFAVPILAFFVLSSLLSFIGKKKKTHTEESYEKTSTRDFAQVLANGGVAGLIVIYQYFFPGYINFLLFLAVVAASTADTWATEIGFFSNKLPRLITNFKRVSKGTSGAISILGTIAAVSGSFIIFVFGYLSNSDLIQQNNFTFFLIAIILSGTIACFFDSFLGATAQAQFRCSQCNKITEKNIHCSTPSELIKGNAKIRNDLVNFFASIFSLCFAIVLHFIWK